jgi:hypothetical protein
LAACAALFCRLPRQNTRQPLKENIVRQHKPPNDIPEAFYTTPENLFLYSRMLFGLKTSN